MDKLAERTGTSGSSTDDSENRRIELANVGVVSQAETQHASILSATQESALDDARRETVRTEPVAGGQGGSHGLDQAATSRLQFGQLMGFQEPENSSFSRTYEQLIASNMSGHSGMFNVVPQPGASQAQGNSVAPCVVNPARVPHAFRPSVAPAAFERPAIPGAPNNPSDLATRVNL